LANVDGSIKVFGVEKGGKVVGLFTMALPQANVRRRKADIPAGLAVSPDGKRLYVVLNLSNRLAELDATTGKALRFWEVGTAPFDVVLAGHKAYVSNWGGDRPDTNSVTGPAGQGTLVRVDPMRFIASEGSVSVIDLSATDLSTQFHNYTNVFMLHAWQHLWQSELCHDAAHTLSSCDRRNAKHSKPEPPNIRCRILRWCAPE
jgi:hypothetical protein